MSLAEKHVIIPSLNNSDERTYRAIFHHPVAHNLEWGNVRKLLEVVAVVKEGHNGHLTVTRQGKSIHLPKAGSKDPVSLPDVKRIRDFLEETEEPPTTEVVADGRHWLVVINHDAARIYRTEMHGAKPLRVTPHDPEGRGRHIHQFRTDGKHRPVRKEFYESVADALKGADRILLFGHGVGESSAMDELYYDLERLHPDLVRRVVGRVVIDPHHTPEEQLLAKAREYYSINPM